MVQSFILALEFVCGFSYRRHAKGLLLVLLLRRIPLRASLYRRLPQPRLRRIIHERPELRPDSSVGDIACTALRVW